jgi:hypothetical protein
MKTNDLFENADYHTVTPTKINYQVSALPIFAHQVHRIRFNFVRRSNTSGNVARAPIPKKRKILRFGRPERDDGL